MTAAEDDRDVEELWDPDLHRRAVLAMSMSERLALLDSLCRQLGAIEMLPPRSP